MHLEKSVPGTDKSGPGLSGVVSLIIQQTGNMQDLLDGHFKERLYDAIHTKIAQEECAAYIEHYRTRDMCTKLALGGTRIAPPPPPRFRAPEMEREARAPSPPPPAPRAPQPRRPKSSEGPDSRKVVAAQRRAQQAGIKKRAREGVHPAMLCTRPICSDTLCSGQQADLELYAGAQAAAAARKAAKQAEDGGGSSSPDHDAYVDAVSDPKAPAVQTSLASQPQSAGQVAGATEQVADILNTMRAPSESVNDGRPPPALPEDSDPRDWVSYLFSC